MEQNLTELVVAKNAMILKGQILEATERYFSQNATTTDFDGTETTGKAAMVSKMQGFTGAIAKVNSITLHKVADNGEVSFSEFTFDFDMQDGSHVLWHEIIRSVWKNGEIVNEQYFKA